MNREPEPVERAHFPPAVGDLGYLDLGYRVVWIGYTDYLAQTRTVDGDIASAKSWCGFKHPHGASSIYTTWREQIKVYIVARLLDPGRLTESHVDLIVSFARSLSPVKEHIELIKCQYHPDDVEEFIRHLKILVKDSTKKLQTSNECHKAGNDLCGDVADHPRKYFQSLLR